MSAREQIPMKPAAVAPVHVNEASALQLTTPRFGTLQRKCACGGSAGAGDECEGCKKQTPQRRTKATGSPFPLHRIMGSAGAPFNRKTPFGSCVGHDFGRVRVDAARSPAIPAQLQISMPGDSAELEADRVAAQIMRMPLQAETHEPARQREPRTSPVTPISQCAQTAVYRQPDSDQQEEKDQSDAGPVDNDMPKPPDLTQCPGPTQAQHEDENKIQRQYMNAESGNTAKLSAGQNTSVISNVAELMNEAGSPLSSKARSFFEPRFGYDFGHVRVHADGRAAASARAVQARAYTLGNHIVLGDGQYAPESSAGRHLLAHELTHVLQQKPTQLLPMASDHLNPAVRIGHQDVGASALQRWSIGDLNNSINTIVCDGSGGVTTQLNATGNADQTRCLRDCIEGHEQSHRSDALAENSTICKGIVAGKTVRPNAGAQRNATEIKASNVEIACIRPQLDKVGEVCKGIMQARITQMEGYRDSFK